jgi:hypothetical protein
MNETNRLRLLEIDSAINLLLGVALLGMPQATIAFLGLPAADEIFYVSILGAVLIGIGIALWVERKNDERWRGLGLFGALVINLVAGGVVCVWLVIDPFAIPTRGYVVLWTVAIVVVGTGAAELITLMRRRTM